MSAKDGLYPAVWFECQSPHHADLINEVPELILWEQAIFYRFGEPITQTFAIRLARANGWRKVTGKWICPLCIDKEATR